MQFNSKIANQTTSLKVIYTFIKPKALYNRVNELVAMPQNTFTSCTYYINPNPNPTKEIQATTRSPKTSLTSYAQRSHESPNAPRPFPCLDPRNLREVEREYNDSVNGHPRA